jgi:ubiquinone/menaquinone biosynthesis C-methylase UbiE
LYPNEKHLFIKYYAQGTSILDLACGGGRTTVRLYEMGYKVKGVDLSDVLISAAHKRFPYITFEEGNYTDIKEEDSSYDNILISHNSLDYAFPEEDREKAISECARVIRKGGTLVMSSHNIKSLYFSPFYWKRHKWFLIKNICNGFGFYDKKYILALKMYTFFATPEYIIKQIEKHGFIFKEMIGFRPFFGRMSNKYLSPYIHYVFIKK